MKGCDQGWQCVTPGQEPAIHFPSLPILSPSSAALLGHSSLSLSNGGWFQAELSISSKALPCWGACLLLCAAQLPRVLCAYSLICQTGSPLTLHPTIQWAAGVSSLEVWLPSESGGAQGRGHVSIGESMPGNMGLQGGQHVEPSTNTGVSACGRGMLS